MFAVATALGEAVARHLDKTLILLVDQIDQVPAPVFQPIISLLRRTNAFTAVLASRPCPTAPEEALMPSDLVAGESYHILSMGRETDLAERQSLIAEVLQKLPFSEPTLRELSARTSLLAALTWPSTRLAIQICQLYEQLKSLDHGADSWANAILEVSHRYEDVVKDGLRAWCANPSELLREWRQSARKGSPDQSVLARARIRISRDDLFRTTADPAAGFLRVGLKAGILFPAADDRYVLDHLPDRFEIAPLLLITDSSRLSFVPREHLVEWEVKQSDLKRWVTRARRREIRTKLLFLAHWMSDPKGTPELQEILRARLLNTVSVVTGEIHGSPQWSPKILEKVTSCNIELCELTTPRRDVFVEYGWAIGLNKPVLQVVKSTTSRPEYPEWVKARQFQSYETDEEKARLVSSIIRLLNEPPDRVDRWFWEPPSIDMAFSPKPSVITFLGPADLVEDARQRCGNRIAEFALEQEYLPIEDTSGILFEAIRKARGAGTLVLLFNGRQEDYLTCVAGGIFTTRENAYAGVGRHLRRQLFIANRSGLAAKDALPGLLTSYGRAVVLHSLDELLPALSERCQTINKWLKSNRKKTGK